MTTHVSSRPILYIPTIIVTRVFDVIHIPQPRPRTLITGTLLVVGLSFPMLMTLGYIPFTFPLAFSGFALTATGGILALIFYGEI